MKKKIEAAPTLENSATCTRVVHYAESDGEPMAETPKHQKVMIDCMDVLRRRFRDVPDVYIAGNMFMYYEEGNPRKSVSPDVFLVRGLSQKADIRTYKTWEQPPTLDFVLEAASPSTYRQDFNVKKEIYAKMLRVKEYYIYDPYYEIRPPFIGFRLIAGAYEEIGFVEGRLPSEVLGLDLSEHEGRLRFYDPMTATWVPTSPELVEDAEARAAQENRARQAVEAKLAEALETLERLRTSE